MGLQGKQPALTEASQRYKSFEDIDIQVRTVFQLDAVVKSLQK